MGETIEKYMFVEVQINPHIDESMLQPRTSRESLAWFGVDNNPDLNNSAISMIWDSNTLPAVIPRAKRVSGQLVKLNPLKPNNPVVWSLHIPGRVGGKGGLWATPALYAGHLYVPTHKGSLLTVNAETGLVTSDIPMPSHGWSSPVVIDKELLVPDCEGVLHKFSLANPAKPRLIWRYDVPGAGCWESTPAVWDGVIYMGNRDGYFYAIGEAHTPKTILANVRIQ